MKPVSVWFIICCEIMQVWPCWKWNLWLQEQIFISGSCTSHSLVIMRSLPPSIAKNVICKVLVLTHELQSLKDTDDYFAKKFAPVVPFFIMSRSYKKDPVCEPKETLFDCWKDRFVLKPSTDHNSSWSLLSCRQCLSVLICSSLVVVSSRILVSIRYQFQPFFSTVSLPPPRLLNSYGKPSLIFFLTFLENIIKKQ